MREEITFFEISTAAALLLFSREAADVLLLEVGLGGRLDATNVIEQPLATVVTPISIDHTEYLGPTLEHIAAEKAGIFKHGSPAVIARQKRQRLRSSSAPPSRRHALYLWRTVACMKKAVVSSFPTSRVCSICRVLVYSAAIRSITRARLLQRFARSALGIPASAIEVGLQKADWPARMQNLSGGKLAGILPAGSELWLDGGHNAAGADAVAAAVGEMEERVPRPLVLIAGMLTTKNAEDFLARFSGIARYVFAVPRRARRRGPLPRSYPPRAKSICGSGTELEVRSIA